MGLRAGGGFGLSLDVFNFDAGGGEGCLSGFSVFGGALLKLQSEDQDGRFRVSGFGFRVWGSRFRV